MGGIQDSTIGKNWAHVILFSMATNGTRILVIEDDPAVAQSLSAALSTEQYQVVCQTCGVEGVKSAHTANPHLILLDLRLPDGSGLDFCRQMRTEGLRQPILILTAQKDEMDKVLGLEMGADDYITKPFSLRELFSRIRAHLRRAYGDYAAASATTLLIHDLVIDLNSGQVRRDNRLINLTPIEYKLLTQLASHVGQVLTRQQLIEAVWGYTTDLDSEKTVNVHIRRLREKIEPNPAEPQILMTVPGIGYRITP